MQDQYSRSLLRYFINLCTLTNSPSKSALSLQPSFTVFHPFVSKRNLFFSKLLFPKTLFRPRERNKEARLFHTVFREKRWKGSLRGASDLQEQPPLTRIDHCPTLAINLRIIRGGVRPRGRPRRECLLDLVCGSHAPDIRNIRWAMPESWI